MVDQVDGLQRLTSTLEAAARDLIDLSEVHADAGRYLTGKAQAAAPRLTGRLAESHTYTARAGYAEVTAGTPYAAAVHARKPWLASTLTKHTDDVLDIYATHVDDIVQTIKGA